MPEIVYVLCALTSVTCALLLLKNYCRSRTKLLLWTAFSFIAFAANNILLVIDLMVVPNSDLSGPRTIVLLVGFFALLYGLIWEKA